MLQTLAVKWLIWAAAACLLSIVAGYFLLPVLTRLKVGQTIRAEGPKRHLTKAGTPTMGGLIFIFATLVVFALVPGKAAEDWLWLFSFLSFGLVGFLDDMYKVVLHRNLGLTAKQKLVAQFLAVALLLAGNAVLCDRSTAIYSASQLFAGNVAAGLNLGWFYYIIAGIFIVGMVNAVNLTDGLDGLATGVSIPVFVGFMLTSGVLFKVGDLPQSISIYSAALVGACLGFLVYNHYPARVFMGDTGSMALGGAAAGFMLISRLEVLFLGIGLVYLAEAVSVMLQVASFKLTGKRIFLMSPLHHHFELKGWRETRVTAMFCLASAVCVALSLLLTLI